MKQHEREYFVARIRSGIYTFSHNDITIKVLTPTLEDEVYANEVYMKAYDKALDEEIMTEQELLDWMRSRELWTEEDDQKIKGLEKDLERLKVEIFKARNNEPLKNQIRKYLRAGEKQLMLQLNKKMENHSNTCEGIAIIEKSLAYLKRCTFVGSEPFDFKSINLNTISQMFYSMLLTEKEGRELARTEPWRSLWMLNDSGTINLFANKDRELSTDQKNILIWSRMYDNIQESVDCPGDDVIEDDDMLDGWFIVQRKKHAKQKAEAEIESSLTNSKISNSDEIFMAAGTQKDADNINNMNDLNAQMIKKQRAEVIKSKGGAEDLDFMDQQLKVRRQSNEHYKGKFGR